MCVKMFLRLVDTAAYVNPGSPMERAARSTEQMAAVADAQSEPTISNQQSAMGRQGPGAGLGSDQRP